LNEYEVVTYDTGRTYMEGWYTLAELQEVIKTMEMLNNASKDGMSDTTQRDHHA